jgi:hypothetical protein
VGSCNVILYMNGLCGFIVRQSRITCAQISASHRKEVPLKFCSFHLNEVMLFCSSSLVQHFLKHKLSIY